MRLGSKAATFASVALTSMASSVAFAQSGQASAEPGFDGVQDIIVTARRAEERLQDVPISITVFSQQQISNRNIVSAGDLATYTPSLTTNSRFGAESTSFAIRGFTQEAGTSPSVAVYFADVVAPRSNGGTTSGNGAGVGSFFDLQNVQVLKGPQGTLFGRNTTGGAVLLVPQRPTADFGGYVEGTLGNYDMRRIQGAINLPLNDNVRLRIGGDYQNRDGYLRNVTDVGPRDFADVNYFAVRASLVADLTPNLENYAIVSYSDSDTNGFYPKVYVDTNSPAPRVKAAVVAQLALTNGQGYYAIANGSANPRQHIRQLSLINTTVWRISDAMSLKNIVSYAQFRQATSGHIFGDYSVSSINPLTVFNVGTDLQAAPGSNNAQQSTFTEELQLSGNVADNLLTYQVGVYHENSKPLDGFQTTFASLNLDCSNLASFQCSDLLGRSLGREGRIGSASISAAEYRFRNIGLYGQATYQILPELSLTGGLRYSWDRTIGDGRSLRGNFFVPNVPTFVCAVPSPLTQGGTSDEVLADPARCSTHRVVNSSAPTFLIDLDYKPVEDVLVYAKFTRGYRQGSTNVSFYGFDSWGPEKVDAYEVGAKTSFGGALRGVFNVAAFHNILKNQQIQAIALGCSFQELSTRPAQCPFIAASSSGIVTGGKARIDGVEVDASISPLTGLRLDANYAYLKTKLLSAALPPPPIGFGASLNRAIVGGPLSLTPKNKIAATASYTPPLPSSVGAVTLSATYTYQSRVFTNAASPVAFRFLPSQENLNLNLNWNDVLEQPIDLSLFVTNVTRERYFLNTLGASFGFDAAVLNQPRMFGIRVRYKLGR